MGSPLLYLGPCNTVCVMQPGLRHLEKQMPCGTQSGFGEKLELLLYIAPPKWYLTEACNHKDCFCIAFNCTPWNVSEGLERQLSGLEHLLLWQRTWVANNCQHPQGSSQPMVTPVPEDMISSSDLSGPQACIYTYIYKGKTLICMVLVCVLLL